MVDFFLELLKFVLQASVIVVATLIIVGFVFSLMQKGKEPRGLKVQSLNKKLDRLRQSLEAQTLAKKDAKKSQKNEKKGAKTLRDRPATYVLRFDGDIRASGVDSLRQEISGILMVAKPGDDVVACIKSPGGVVNGYGLAASQLQRLAGANIPLTACIDEVAASGGYMMASVAEKIYAAPFAIIGSIGVVASLPNFHRLLKKKDIDYLEMTAGEYKRTVTTLGPITDQGVDKFKQQLEDIHGLFKDHVAKSRPQLDIAKVATGEYWFGTQALNLGLIDALKTSDTLLCDLCGSRNVLEVSYREKVGLKEKLAEGLSAALEKSTFRILSTLESPK